MTRFAWLQARSQTAVAAAAIGALAIVALVTGVHLSSLYDSLVAHCRTNCDPAIEQFGGHYHFLQNAFTLLPRLVPALFGIFVGAPLFARELENGTFRLVWTQSVSRTRWIAIKLLVGAVITVLLAGLLTITITWWFHDLDKIDLNQYGAFDTQDLAPVGYALCAFAFGTVAGAIFRRTLPAMASSLAVFVFARIAVQLWVRPHLMPTKSMGASLLDGKNFGFVSYNGGPIDIVSNAPGKPNSWVLATHILNRSGRPSTATERAAFIRQYCPGIATPPPPPKGGNGVSQRLADPSTFESCRAHAAQVFHLSVTYQPANHYWPLQLLETAVFVGLALLAMAGSYWWLTRRAV